ncbi:MAG: hypothetical protein AB7E55_33935 [Pigmentiphaga sp.]
MEPRYSIEEIEAWIENNPGGNDWLLAILHDGERGIARFACDRAVAEADAQERERND